MLPAGGVGIGTLSSRAGGGGPTKRCTRALRERQELASLRQEASLLLEHQRVTGSKSPAKCCLASAHLHQFYSIFSEYLSTRAWSSWTFA